MKTCMDEIKDAVRGVRLSEVYDSMIMLQKIMQFFVLIMNFIKIMRSLTMKLAVLRGLRKRHSERKCMVYIRIHCLRI